MMVMTLRRDKRRESFFFFGGSHVHANPQENSWNNAKFLGSNVPAEGTCGMLTTGVYPVYKTPSRLREETIYLASPVVVL